MTSVGDEIDVDVVVVFVVIADEGVVVLVAADTPAEKAKKLFIMNL